MQFTFTFMNIHAHLKEIINEIAETRYATTPIHMALNR